MIEYTKEKFDFLNEINEQAKIFFDNKEYDKSLECFEKIKFEEFPEELKINLAKCYYYNRQAHRALEILDSIKDNDTDIEFYLDKAVYKNAIGDFDGALKIYKSLDQSDPRVKFNTGWHMLRNGDFKGGFEYIEYGSKCRAWGHEYIHIENGTIDPSKRWDGKYTNRLLLFLEGGIGDCFIFLRWAKYLETMCDNLIILAPQSLQRLLMNSEYEVIPDTFIASIDYDHYVPSMSIPNFIDISGPKDRVTFPYIHSFSEPYIEKTMQKMCSMHPNSDMKIGVRWMGNPEFEHDQFRTIPKESFYDLSKYGTLFSLQMEEESDDEHFIPCRHVIRDWQDTYSIFSHLDLLITSCTSTAHLAGAMNIPTIVMPPFVPYFVWADEKNSWYESVKVIKQSKYNDWTESIDMMYEIVDKFTINKNKNLDI